MQKITSANTNGGATIDNVAVSKGSGIVYFYIDTAKDTTVAISNKETVIALETGHGLVAGDYCKIDDEVMEVISSVALAITVRRARRNTAAASHSTESVYKEQDHLTNTELNEATNPVPESMVVVDLQKPEWYDISIEAKVVSGGTDVVAGLTMYWGFSGYNDIVTPSSYLVDVEAERNMIIGMASGVTKYYCTDTIRPTGRYLYLWLVSAASVASNDSEVYITINQV